MQEFAPELFWLVMTCVLTGLLWIPYILQRIVENGFLTSLLDPQGLSHTRAPWASRMMRAHHNAIENLAIFAPLVLVTLLTGSSNSMTATACLVYFIARAAHVLVYTFAIPLLRTVAFLAGFWAQAVLAFTLLETIA